MECIGIRWSFEYRLTREDRVASDTCMVLELPSDLLELPNSSRRRSALDFMHDICQRHSPSSPKCVGDYADLAGIAQPVVHSPEITRCLGGRGCFCVG